MWKSRLPIVAAYVAVCAFANAGTVTNTNDSGSGSLRQAIADAVTGETINFAPGVTGLIQLTTGELVIDKNLTIQGPGANLLRIDADFLSPSRVFRVSSSAAFNFTLSGLKLGNGNAGAGSGGAIFQDSGTLTIANCTFYGNSASKGGALGLGGATLKISGSTFTVNSTRTGGFGGAIYANNGTLLINNCTITENQADATGGIFADGGNITVHNSTIVANTGFGINSHGGGIASGVPATIHLGNTIVAENISDLIIDLSGSYISDGHNFIARTDGSTGLVNGVNGDQVGTPASPIPIINIFILSDNGGPTETMKLARGSGSVIDKGVALVDPTTGFATTTDQRGLPRPVDDPTVANPTGGDAADIGAFELQLSEIGPTPTPTPAPTPIISLSVSTALVNEGSDAIFTVSASTVNPSQPLTVSYSIKSKAQQTIDYTLSGNPLQFIIPAGQSSATVILHTLTDALSEKNEKFTVKLSKGVGYKLSTAKKATVTIVNVP